MLAIFVKYMINVTFYMLRAKYLFFLSITFRHNVNNTSKQTQTRLNVYLQYNTCIYSYRYLKYKTNIPILQYIRLTKPI